MNATIYFRLVWNALFCNSASEDDATLLGKLKKRNWGALGVRSLVMLVCIALLWIGTLIFLGDTELYGIPAGNTVFTIGIIVVALFWGEWAIKSLYIPVGLFQKIWQDEIVEEVLKENDTFEASKLITQDFWASVAKNGLSNTLHPAKAKKVKAQKPARNEASVKQEPLIIETSNTEDEDGEDRWAEPQDPVVKKVTARKKAQKKQNSSQDLMVRLAVISTLIGAGMLILTVFALVKDFMVAIAWVVALVILAGVVLLLLKINRMKNIGGGVKGVFNVIYAIVIIAVLGLAVTWSIGSVRSNLLGAIGINSGGALAAVSGAQPEQGLIPTISLPSPTTTPTGAPLTATAAPKKFVVAVGEYSLKTKLSNSQDMTADLNNIVESANSIAEAYKKAMQVMVDQKADMPEYSKMCFGVEGFTGIIEASTQNVQFLTAGSIINGEAVPAYMQKLDTLQETKAIQPEDAERLRNAAKVLVEFFNQNIALCDSTVALESQATISGNDYNNVDKGKVSGLWAKAKETVVQINNLADAYSKLKNDTMTALQKLEGRDGKGLIEFLEEAYPAAEEKITITATPGPTQPNIVNTLLPPTATASPMPATATPTACQASTSIDDGKTFITYAFDLTEFVPQFKVSDTIQVEGYSETCVGFVFAFDADVNGDGNKDWGVVQEISLMPGLNQYQQVGHDAKGFSIKYAQDPMWPNTDEYYLFRTDTNEVVRRNWPIPTEIAPTATQHASEVQTCRPADQNTYHNGNKVPMRWQEIYSAFGGVDGKARYTWCTTMAYFTVQFQAGGGTQYYWFTQTDVPNNINAGAYFWVNYQGNAYVWSANPTKTPTPNSLSQCYPPRRDVYTDYNKVPVRWQELGTAYPDVQGYAWYHRCGGAGYYFVVMIMNPDQNSFKLYWFVQADNPSSIGEGSAFWVSKDGVASTREMPEPE